MQIILVHPRLAQARTVNVSKRHVLLIATAVFALVCVMAVLLDIMVLRSERLSRLAVTKALFSIVAQSQAGQSDRYVRENIDAMAIKLGAMQAQIMRLEALGERVSGLAGISQQEFNLKDPPSRGGAAPTSGRSLTLKDFQSQLDAMGEDLERRGDYLNVVESALMTEKLKSKMMPTIQPVNVSYNASGFGPRIDPFTGKLTMHEGIDFDAAPGTPIVAAAGGVVITSEWRHDFGNMIEIDHGNDITTLYAHASRVYVHVGDVVRRNQHIADVGATGRATGPHLHFEVHVRGIPQNPAKFLEAQGPAAPQASVNPHGQVAALAQNPRLYH